MLPILLLLDPNSLLALGKCSKRLHRLVCDHEVWRHLVRRILEFNLEMLKDLGDFAAESDTRQDMTAEVLKQKASHLTNGSVQLACRNYQLTLRIKNFPDTYKLWCCQFEKFIEVVEAMGSSTLTPRERALLIPDGDLELVKVMGSSPFNILEILSENVFHCPLGWIATHVERQEELLVKLRIGIMPFLSEDQSADENLDFFTILKKSQRWEVGSLICRHGSNWAPVARFASTGSIVRLDFDTHIGGLKEVKKEDARKIWEISGGIRVKNSESIQYFGRLEENFFLDQGVWSLVNGYKRREPPEGFDPEVNWQRLVTFAGWEESEGEPS